MLVIEPSYEIVDDISEGGERELKKIERAARLCYKSEKWITDDAESAKRLIRFLIKRGHEAMLEHSQLSVIFTTDRAVSHELVRHRLASFAQESQRYCNYEKDDFGGQIIFVRQRYLSEDLEDFAEWWNTCSNCEAEYLRQLDRGMTPQQARCVLPNCTKTEIMLTANYREWRHILKLRTAPDAHPDMQALMIPLLKELKEKIPVIFDDIGG